MKVVSLFSGAGGLDLGFQMAGHEIVWANDFYKDAVDTYRNNIGDHIVCDDISKIDTNSIPDCDIVIGGFPCQGFSVANMKRNAKDERNTLYKQLIRVIEAKHPKFFLAENVKGIKTLANGKVFKMILDDFSQMGYVVKEKTLNAADYGVPQTRQRVIIVGVRNDVNFNYVFPRPTNDKDGANGLPKWKSVAEAMEGIPDPDLPNDLPNHDYSKYKLEFNGYIGHRELDPDQPAPTVTARGDSRGGVVILPHPNGKRRMSCREVAAVQSFPLTYAFSGNRSSVYRQIGNAVPPLLGYAVANVFNQYIETVSKPEEGGMGMLSKDFVPVLPFPDFKWRWGSYTCSESINDPVIMLGILFRLRKLELLNRKLRYSSDEFASELIDLSKDTNDSINIDLAHWTGERNIIRNAGQYWRSLGLIPSGDHTGIIRLTEFGKKVADRNISQAEFAAITIQTFKLPNPGVQKPLECKLWSDHGLTIYPLRLILSIVCKLEEIDSEQAYITPSELMQIVIPLSGCCAELSAHVNFILWHRNSDVSLAGWPNCCSRSNDHRMAKEFLIFLSNYGYLNVGSENKYYVNYIILDEIHNIIDDTPAESSLLNAVDSIRSTEVTAEVERKRMESLRSSRRPNQAAFRREVLRACGRCIISNATMPEILGAAHIKPFKYNGENTIANGFAMRTDIHTLFDTGHLRISPDGKVEVSTRVRMDYGSAIPPDIRIPDFV